MSNYYYLSNLADMFTCTIPLKNNLPIFLDKCFDYINKSALSAF